MSERFINKILIVDDEQTVRDLMQAYLARRGYDVTTAVDGIFGLERFEKDKPDLVFTDIVMPRMNGLEMLAKIRDQHPLVFVVVMTGFSDENTAIKSAQLGVVDYLVKPFAPQRVDGILDRMERLAWLRRESKGVIIEDLPMSLDRVDMVLENDLLAANRMVERIMRLMGIRDDDFKLGLLEILVNAIEHGNLEIGYERKSGLPDIHQYMEFVKTRSSQADFAARRVRVSIRRTGDRVECDVVDEGPGFDWRATLENASGIDELLHHGRRLLLAQVMFDSLKFNDRGNHVFMSKTLCAPPAGA